MAASSAEEESPRSPGAAPAAEGEARSAEKATPQLLRSLLEPELAKGVKRVPWVEHLSVTVNKEFDEQDPNQDVHRDEQFHDMALEGVRQGLITLKSMGLPFTRPRDYYADMFKSDKQMHRVRARLADRQARFLVVERRRKRLRDLNQKKKAVKQQILKVD